MHNKVLLARLAPAETDRRIEEVVCDHRERGAVLMWFVDHRSTPADQSRRLEAAGLPCRGASMGMVRSVAAGRAGPPASLRVVPAALADTGTIADLAVRGWECSATFGPSMEQCAERALGEPRGPVSFWLARWADEPVGFAVLRVLPSGLGYLQGACVLPSHRGRGIYVALTDRRLDELEQRGVDTAVIWASQDTSAPIARRIGFRSVPQATFTYHDAEA